MGNANSKEGAAPETKTKVAHPVIDLPGIMGNDYWKELAEEAKTYIRLVQKLEGAPQNAPEREELEEQLIASLNHMVVHGSVLEENVDEAILKEDAHTVSS